MRTQLAIHFFMFLILAAACQSKMVEVKQEEHTPFAVERTYYYVRYLENSKELQAEARFQQDTGNLVLADKLYFEGQVMQPKKLPKVGWEYRYHERPSKFKGCYHFSYGGESDTICFPTYTNFGLKTPEVSMTSGGLIAWEGQPLGQEESLVLLFEDAKGQVKTVNHVGLTRGSQFEIRPEHLEGLNVGAASLRLVHKSTVIQKIDGQVQVIKLEYYRKTLKIEIVA
ncbi:hypothetical protein PPO43_10880 [Saprospira sp. CCB-QB6]|uniref:hypothetical protein n=1 Tax=Saprospira sp. CCB-QB6 TaxID=3023936 RepID=UPI002348F7FA|nr:hypothetical protein [Saprospira sp. CCB-QB6]WCL80471.1 hypothetical protein PPO43_10880 [Saprospira sp. CCB-QB6]